MTEYLPDIKGNDQTYPMLRLTLFSIAIGTWSLMAWAVWS